MASYSPTISVSTTPALQVTMAGDLTYGEFLNSLGQFVYLIDSYFLQCQSIRQIFQPIAYNIFDASGKQYDLAIISNPDPYQYTASIRENLQGRGIVLNGKSTISFDVLPGEFITIILCTRSVNNQEQLNQVHPNNFKQADDSLGNLKLFEDYKNCL